MAKDKKLYTIQEAVKNLKDTAPEKFDASVELHINLELDSNQSVRFTTTPPHGTGKAKKVAVLATQKIAGADLELAETDLQKIETGELKPKVDFEVLIAQPNFMPKVAKVAKILGPAGAMPNPKAGTVTDNVAVAVQEIKKGKIEIKTEKDVPIIHTVLGKKSFSDQDLVENYNSIIKALSQNKPPKAKPNWIRNAFICSSMGPSYQIAL